MSDVDARELDRLLQQAFDAAHIDERAEVLQRRHHTGQHRAHHHLVTRLCGARAGLPVFVPPLSLSTDNAAMIGAAGLRRFRAGHIGAWDFNAEASLSL